MLSERGGQDELQRAIELYTKALETQPLDKHAHIYYNRAGAYARQGWWKESLADAQQCIQLNREWPKGHCRLGAAHFGLDQLDEAAAAYMEALRLAPSDSEVTEGARLALDDVRAKQKRIQMGEKVTPLAIEFARRKAAAGALLAEGKYAEAEAEYMASIDAMRALVKDMHGDDTSAQMQKSLEALEVSMHHELQQARAQRESAASK
mmetsp:Transcript_22620/g.69042  ORF Transcript_22620/g.69042 Transcript_22620/m.69042 type:complete len:207 (-) Transcript_22620:195-815(-)|eukprot:scaffold66592_cov43-Tisochrysis_lutea.AAC.1